MSWIAIALLSAGVSAWTSILDKTIIYRYAHSPLTLPLLIGFAQTFLGLVILAAVRVPDEATWGAVGWSLLSGLLFGLGGLLLMRVLYFQEVSRTIPVWQTSPIFAALIAFAFLDEAISAVQWVSIVAMVTGAGLLSLRTERGYRTSFLHSSFFLLMLGALITATANVAIKLALDDLPLLFTHAIRSLALGFVFIVANMRATPLSEVRDFLTKRSPALLFAGVNEMVVANTGLLLLLWALSQGPVSLVTALAGARALFLVLYSTTLALVWKGALGEDTSPAVITVKVGATGLIVAGMVGIVL